MYVTLCENERAMCRLAASCPMGVLELGYIHHLRFKEGVKEGVNERE